VDNVRLGRRLGIGTRLAAKVLRNQAQKASSNGSASAAMPAAERRQQAARPPAAAQPRSTGTRSARQAVPSGNFILNAARGGRDFGRAFWKPFSAAGRALWHEVTGLFFALFALFFGQALWRFRGAWRSGPQHGYFIGCLVMTVLFAYFSVSAFVRSRRTPH
jgi:hypothetical protein